MLDSKSCSRYNGYQDPVTTPLVPIQREGSNSMYIRITNGRYDVSREDDVKTMVKSTVNSAARRMPGFGTYTAGLDHGSGALTVVTTWETQEQAKGFRDNLDGEILKQIRDIGVELDAPHVYETVV
jgi:hypothetical protein